jgi:hypothetical protein
MGRYGHWSVLWLKKLDDEPPLETPKIFTVLRVIHLC